VNKVVYITFGMGKTRMVRPVIKFSRNEPEHRSGTSSWHSIALIKRCCRERGQS